MMRVEWKVDPELHDTIQKLRRSLAVQGDIRAQYNLGVMYTYGVGTTQDYAEAVRWYRKAASQGNTKAQINIGMMYFLGIGVDENQAEGLTWIRKAADGGDNDWLMV